MRHLLTFLAIALLAAAAWLLVSHEVGHRSDVRTAKMPAPAGAPIAEPPAPAAAPELERSDNVQREEPEIGTGTAVLRGPGTTRGSP